MKRGIDDTIECEAMTTLNQQTVNQLQQQLNNSNQNQNSNSSSSPLSNSSTNSSSCITTNPFSSPASYSPIQHLYQQQLISQGANNPIILTIPMQHQTDPNSILIANSAYNSSVTQKPDAKKVKIQKSQPSKVVHIRNIPQQITEIEVIQFGLIFGNIVNVLNLRSKCQAFLEFEKCEEAQSMINYFANNPISVVGRQIFVQYSNYKNLVTDPTNTNNQVAKAALDLAKELHKAAQSGGQNTVLRAMIQNMLYGVSLDTIYQIFNRFGPVLKIITFTKNDKFQALIQMKDATSAQAAKNGLHGQNIYNSCCTLHIDYSKLNTLNVKYNNEKSRDYTNPLLPAGDCPDHLALGPGGVLNSSLQLSMAAAAAGYGSPFALPPGYHLATAGNPFMFAGKYLPQQTLISAGHTLLQPSAGANLTAASLAQAQAHAHAQNQALVAQSQNPNASHIVSHQSGAPLAYSVNQQNQNHAANNNNQQNHAPQPSVNLNGATLQSLAQSGHVQQTASGQFIFPFLQNINEDAYIMMYPA